MNTQEENRMLRRLGIVETADSHIAHLEGLVIKMRTELILARDTAGKGQMNGEETWHLTAEATKRLKELI